jgi:transposase
MPTLVTPICRFIGCDVGKAAIVVFDSQTGRTQTIANQPQGLASFAATLDAGCFALCEATGGYEAALLAALVVAGIPAHRADARKVKYFIRSRGTLGKTDALDARALALYGEKNQDDLVRWKAPDQDRCRLQALILQRNDLVQDQTRYSNRAKAPNAAKMSGCYTRVLATLKREMSRLDVEIAAIVKASATLRQAADTLIAIPGIGAITAHALLGLMPELGKLDRRKAAALAGLAAHPNQSGAADGYRRTRGGRPEVKRALFMAAMSVAKHHPTLKPFYERLIENGKKKLVALTAVMRKLIVIANAKLRDLAATTALSAPPAG